MMKRKPLLLSVLIAIALICASALATSTTLLTKKFGMALFSSTVNAQHPDTNADELLEQAFSALEEYRTTQEPPQERQSRTSNEIPAWMAIQLIESGRIDQALELTEHVVGYARPLPPLPMTYSERLLLLVDAVASQEETEIALLLLQHILSEGGLNETIEEETYSQYFEKFVAWIESAIQLRKYELAEGLLNKLTTLNKPNLDQQLEIAKLWMKLDQPEQVYIITESLISQELSPEQQGYLYVLLMALGEKQDLLFMLERENLTPGQQLNIALALAEVGQLEEALEIANRQPAVLDAVALYGEPLSSGKLDALTEIAVAFAAVGQRERAQDILNRAAEFVDELPRGYSSHGSCENERNRPYSLIAESFAKIGDFEQSSRYISAIQTCFSMSDPFPSSVPGNRASAIHKILDGIDQVQNVMQLLPENWRVKTDEFDDNAAKAEIAVRLAELGGIREALWVASAIQSVPFWDVDEYLWTPLSSAFAELQASDTTHNFEDEVDTPLEYESIESIPTQIIVMIRAGYEAEQAGNSEKAEQLFHQSIYKMNQLPTHNGNDSSDQSYLTKINVATAFNAVGQRRLAIEVLDSIPPEVTELEVTGFPFVKLLTDLMQFNHAVDAARSIPQLNLQAKSLAYIASKLYEYEK